MAGNVWSVTFITLQTIMLFTFFSDCVVSENIHTPPTEGFFWFEPPPLWKFQFRCILSFKNLAFETPPPLLGISNDPLWWVLRCFLQPHSTLNNLLLSNLKNRFLSQKKEKKNLEKTLPKMFPHQTPNLNVTSTCGYGYPLTQNYSEAD